MSSEYEPSCRASLVRLQLVLVDISLFQLSPFLTESEESELTWTGRDHLECDHNS